MKYGTTTCGVALAFIMAGAVASAGPDVNAIVARINDCDADGKFTAPPPEQMDALCAELLAGGTPAVEALVNSLSEPARDYKARYLLHALAVYSTRPGDAAARRTVGDVLIAILGRDAAVNVKDYALGELQYLLDTQAVEAMATLLNHETLGEPAARAMVAVGAASRLAKALPAVTGANRLNVIQALGERHCTEAVPALVDVLKLGDDVERVAAAGALARMVDARAVAPLLDACAKASGCDRIKITDACFELADGFVAADERDAALGVYRGVWRLYGGLLPPHLRHAIMRGTAGAFAGEDTPSLVAKLRDGDALTRAAILYVLGRHGDAAAFDSVAGALADADPGVRLMAISVLGRVGRERSVPLLVARLPGESAVAEQALADALRNVPGDGAANEALVACLAAAGDAADPDVRRLTLLAILTGRKAPEVADTALVLAVGDNEAIRLQALGALAAGAPAKYAGRVAALLPKLKSPAEERALEEAVLQCCRRAGGAKAQLDPLRELIDGGDVKAGCMALRVAGRLDSRDSASLLVQTFGSSSGDLRDTAVRALAEFPSEVPVNDLLSIAKAAGDVKHQVVALRGVVRMVERERDNAKRLSMLTEAIKVTKRPDEEKLVIAAIGKVQTPQALAALVASLGNADVADEAAQAALGIVERIRRDHGGACVEPLKAVVRSAAGEKLRRRAEGLLKQVE